MRTASSTGFTIEVSLGDLDAEQASRPRSATWPLVLCGLFALGSACAAVTASPLGQRPEVRPYTDVARAGVVVAEDAIVRLARDVRARLR